MKIIHTSDWHLGKKLHKISLLEDQKYMLDKLISFIKEEKPEVLLICGDIYDKAVPPIEAVKLLNEFLTTTILDLNVNVIIIPGNVDNPDRLHFCSDILKENGLYIITNLRDVSKPIKIEDEYGLVNFYPIPYVETIDVKYAFNEFDITNIDSAYKKIITEIEKTVDYSNRNICLAHVNMLSETLNEDFLSNNTQVSCEYFKQFNYVALGHLHRSKKVKYDHIRYSNSLLKYSFTEHLDTKGFTIVDLNKKGEVTVQIKNYKLLRDVRVIRGELKDLLDKSFYSKFNTTDFIFAQLTDKGELLDPMTSLKEVYPNIMKLERVSFERIAGVDESVAQGDIRKREILDLFIEFYENTSEIELDKVKEDTVVEVINQVKRERRQN